MNRDWAKKGMIEVTDEDVTTAEANITILTDLSSEVCQHWAKYMFLYCQSIIEDKRVMKNNEISIKIIYIYYIYNSTFENNVYLANDKNYPILHITSFQFIFT